MSPPRGTSFSSGTWLARVKLSIWISRHLSTMRMSEVRLSLSWHISRTCARKRRSLLKAQRRVARRSPTRLRDVRSAMLKKEHPDIWAKHEPDVKEPEEAGNSWAKHFEAARAQALTRAKTPQEERKVMVSSIRSWMRFGKSSSWRRGAL